MDRPFIPNSNNDTDIRTANGASTAGGRIRKRISNACTRCRQQKIKCSGNEPCQQCTRRHVRCVFESGQQKVFVSQKYLAQLESRVAAAAAATTPILPPFQHQQRPSSGSHGTVDSGIDLRIPDEETGMHVDERAGGLIHEREASNFMVHAGGGNIDPEVSESEADEEAEEDAEGEGGSHAESVRITPEDGLGNPIDPGNSDSFTVSTASKHYFLGVSSNWSFGRRVFKMVHDSMHDQPLSSADLFFEGCTYDLGWDGQRAAAAIDTSALPTADFALFLINAVKFRCGCLFHLFDEESFMRSFKLFYDPAAHRAHVSKLWVIHFLILLAFGKAFIVRSSKASRPPGSELFVQAMQHLPDTTFLHHYPFQSIEILCCAALYLQCLDMRSAAYDIIGQAMRLALGQGMHTDLRSRHLSTDIVERCREIWWTVFVLDRQMTSLMGVPMGVSDDDVTAPLPSFGGSTEKLIALDLHVKLAKAQAVVSQTVYGKSGRKAERFISSMKDALKTIAAANDQRNESFPIDLKSRSSSISRVSAYLHLFHYQALILATRPLLFSYLQKRLESPKPLRISGSHGARHLLRVCVSSASQCLNILEALRSRDLLESFIPFDLEATSTSALVLIIASAVDPSLIRNSGSGNGNGNVGAGGTAPSDHVVDIADSILDEMTAHGNLIACHHRRELEQLRTDLRGLSEQQQQQQRMESRAGIAAATTATMTAGPDDGVEFLPAGDDGGADPRLPLDASTVRTSSSFDGVEGLLNEWNSDDGFTGEHLMAVAESFDFDQLDFPDLEDFDQNFGIYGL